MWIANENKLAISEYISNSLSEIKIFLRMQQEVV